MARQKNAQSRMSVLSGDRIRSRSPLEGLVGSGRFLMAPGAGATRRHFRNPFERNNLIDCIAPASFTHTHRQLSTAVRPEIGPFETELLERRTFSLQVLPRRSVREVRLSVGGHPCAPRDELDGSFHCPSQLP